MSWGKEQIFDCWNSLRTVLSLLPGRLINHVVAETISYWLKAEITGCGSLVYITKEVRLL